MEVGEWLVAGGAAVLIGDSKKVTVCTQAIVVHRRKLLERDPPYDFAEALREIRKITGLGTSGIAFVLNMPRSTIWSIEAAGCRPNVDDGDAIRKYLAICRLTGT